MSREVSKVLEDLRLVIAQAQVDAASIGVIQQIDLEFVVEVQKKVGVSNPAIWLIPEALLDLGSDQIQTTTMTRRNSKPALSTAGGYRLAVRGRPSRRQQ